MAHRVVPRNDTVFLNTLRRTIMVAMIPLVSMSLCLFLFHFWQTLTAADEANINILYKDAKIMDQTLDNLHRSLNYSAQDPSVVGFSMYNAKTQEFEFKEGAVMCNLFLADEINRTSSKTQSALLEAMEEGQVTVDGVTRPLPQPFVVIATQNPVGSAGTQMLPESQLDRFMIRLSMGYPDAASEVLILKDRQGFNPLDSVRQVVNADDIIIMQEEVDELHVDDAVLEYITMLSASTRQHPMIELGMSPRGTIALASMAKAHAYISGRAYVSPDDVQKVFKDVACHRIILNPRAKISAVTVDGVVKSIFQTVPVPRAAR